MINERYFEPQLMKINNIINLQNKMKQLDFLDREHEEYNTVYYIII